MRSCSASGEACFVEENRGSWLRAGLEIWVSSFTGFMPFWALAFVSVKTVSWSTSQGCPGNCLRERIWDLSSACSVHHRVLCIYLLEISWIQLLFPNVVTSPIVQDTKYQAPLPELLDRLWNGLPVSTLDSFHGAHAVHSACGGLFRMHNWSRYTRHLPAFYTQQAQSLNSFTQILG